jgi:hypothetical protein
MQDHGQTASLVWSNSKESETMDDTQEVVDNDEDDMDDDDEKALVYLMAYDTWPEDVCIEFDRAKGFVTLENFRVDFVAAEAKFRALEAEFLPRLEHHEENARELRRHITEGIFLAAYIKEQPFDTYQSLWNELSQLGFSRIERRCNQTWLFADCCRKHGQTEIGLGVLDPLIAELERLRADPAVTTQAAEYYDQQLDNLGKLRAQLEAQSAAPH